MRAFPTGNAKPASLAEQLKASLAGETGIKINEIRYIAEDSSIAGAKIAANLTAKVLGAQGDKFRDFLDDPNRLLQMILAAEGSRGGSGGSGGGSGPGFGGPGFGGPGMQWVGGSVGRWPTGRRVQWPEVSVVGWFSGRALSRRGESVRRLGVDATGSVQ